jgi:hypothetical protein
METKDVCEKRIMGWIGKCKLMTRDILFFMIGFTVCSFIAYSVFQYRLYEFTKVQAMLYKGVVYEVKIKP